MNRKHAGLAVMLALMIGVNAGTASTAVAAQVSSGGVRMEKLNTALAQLGLSPKQKSQITQILADAKSSLSSRKSGVTTGATTGAGKSKGRQFMQKIMGVLTAPQQAKLKQILKAERSKAAKA